MLAKNFILFFLAFCLCSLTIAGRPDLLNMYNSDGSLKNLNGDIDNLATTLVEPDWQAKTELMKWNFGSSQSWKKTETEILLFPFVAQSSLLSQPLIIGSVNANETLINSQFEISLVRDDPTLPVHLVLELWKEPSRPNTQTLQVDTDLAGNTVITLFDGRNNTIVMSGSFSYPLNFAMAASTVSVSAMFFWVNGVYVKGDVILSDLTLNLTLTALEVSNVYFKDVKFFSPVFLQNKDVEAIEVFLDCTHEKTKSDGLPFYDCANYPPTLLEPPKIPPLFIGETIFFTPEIKTVTIKLSDVFSHPDFNNLEISLKCNNVDGHYQLSLSNGTNPCGLSLNPSSSIVVGWSTFQVTWAQLEFTASYADSLPISQIVNVGTDLKISITTGAFTSIPLTWVYELLNSSQKKSQFSFTEIIYQNSNYPTNFLPSPPPTDRSVESAWWEAGSISFNVYPSSSNLPVDCVGGLIQQVTMKFSIQSPNSAPYSGMVTINIQPFELIAKPIFIPSKTILGPLVFNESSAFGLVDGMNLPPTLFETSEMKRTAVDPLISVESVSHGSTEEAAFGGVQFVSSDGLQADMTFHLYDNLTIGSRVLSNSTTIKIYPLLTITPLASKAPKESSVPMKISFVLSGFLNPESTFRFDVLDAGYFSPPSSSMTTQQSDPQQSDPQTADELTMIDPELFYGSEVSILILNNMYSTTHVAIFGLKIYEKNQSGQEKLFSALVVVSDVEFSLKLANFILIIIIVICVVVGSVTLIFGICCVRKVLIKRQERKSNELKLAQIEYLNVLVQNMEDKVKPADLEKCEVSKKSDDSASTSNPEIPG